jgi:citrate lyase subunit beta / citryl-CoA lyase
MRLTKRSRTERFDRRNGAPCRVTSRLMSAPIRPRRSLLFMPASNRRALEKARTLPADGLIFDLEDAVAPAAKAAARSTLAAALTEGGYGRRELVLRVNGLDTPWGHADLMAAATMPIDAVLLPKVESAERVRQSLSLLAAFAAPPRLALWCMIETPLGILELRGIATASPLLAALVLGTSDLTKDLQAQHRSDRLPLVDGRLVENLHVENARRLLLLAEAIERMTTPP